MYGAKYPASYIIPVKDCVNGKFFCAEMRKIVKRKENAVKSVAAVLRTVMIPMLLLGWQGACMNVQAAEEAPVQAEIITEELQLEDTAEEAVLQPEGTAEEAVLQPEGTVEEAVLQPEDAALSETPADAEAAQVQPENAEDAVLTQPEAAEEVLPPLSVTMVGDSVLLGASPSILAVQPDYVIDAKVGRQLVQSGSVLDSLEAQGLLRQTVVMELGTNGAFSVEKGQELINRLGSGRTIYWVTVYGRELGWQEESNATIRQLATQNENVHIIDWSQAVSGHPEWLCGDGIHLSAAGRDAYANIVLGGLQQFPEL